MTREGVCVGRERPLLCPVPESRKREMGRDVAGSVRPMETGGSNDLLQTLLHILPLLPDERSDAGKWRDIEMALA